MPSTKDGPSTTNFVPLTVKGNNTLSGLSKANISKEMKDALEHAPCKSCISWGIPFEINKVVLVEKKEDTVSIKLDSIKAEWFVFMHTSDIRPLEMILSISSLRGAGQLGEHAANYVIIYDNGTEQKIAVKRRHQIGMFSREWGENCFESVGHSKPHPRRVHHEQIANDWGSSQCRVDSADFEPSLDEKRLLKQIQLDMGQIISAQKRPVYANKEWTKTYNNQTLEVSPNEILVEYTAHQDAEFYLADGKTISVAKFEEKEKAGPLQIINSPTRRVRLRAVEREKVINQLLLNYIFMVKLVNILPLLTATGFQIQHGLKIIVLIMYVEVLITAHIFQEKLQLTCLLVMFS